MKKTTLAGSLAAAMVLAALPTGSHAALHTARFAEAASTQTINGALGTNEYGPGNSQSYSGGGTGFGGTVGSGTIYMANDATNLYIAFDPGAALNDIGVLYLNTRAGGFTDADMNDTADNGRNMVSNLGSFGNEVFPASLSSAPDFAVVFADFGIVVFELNAGAAPNHLEFKVFSDVSALGNSDTLVREIAIPWTALETSPANPIEFFMAYSAPSGFLSNESIPPSPTLNAATPPGNTAIGSYENHNVYYPHTATVGTEGTYTVGPGGSFSNLVNFVDAATGVRELTGTLNVTASATTITGTDTLFLSEVQVGDVITFSTGAFRGVAQYLTVTAVTDNTSLTVTAGATANGLAAGLQKASRIRTPASFPRVLTGNMTALIVGDTTEPVNISVALNTGGNTLTFRPAPGASPTVTFARNLDQDGFSGDFVIGTVNSGANAVVTTTDNIVIDGSNTVGGTTRDMTWTAAKTHSSSTPIHVTAGADNVIIRNVRVINNGTSTGGNVSAIRASSVQYAAGTTAWNGFNAGFAAAGTYVPNGLTIQNCELSAIGGSQGAAINITSTGTLAASQAPTGLLFTNNDIAARIRGVFMSPAGSVTISNNRIAVGLGGSTSGLGTFGVFNNTTNGFAATQNIVGNSIYVVTDAAGTAIGPSGVFASTHGAGSVVSIDNNTIKLVNNNAAPTRPTLNRGIVVTSGVTYNMRHNTIDMSYVNPPAAGLISPAFSYGMGQFLAGGNITIQNNIINNRISGGAAYWRPNAPTGTFAVNDNLINVSGPVATNLRSVATAGSPTRASSGNTRTLFFGTTSHGITAGQTVTVQLAGTAANAAAYEGTFVVDTVPNVNTITYTAATALTESATANTFTVAAPAAAPITATTLAEWQATTSTPDLISTAGDPGSSLSLANLHLINTAAAGLVATAQVGGITTDIDGATRSATPNRGADEFAANTAPTAILGSPVASIAENATGVVVNNVRGVDADTLDFPVITATSTAGAVSVSQISPSAYRINLTTAIDFETNPSFDVNVTATDMAGATTTQAYTIAVTNVNEAPTAISPTTASIDENAGANALVATLSTTDPDAGDTHTYTLETGVGSTDNALFQIAGNQLQAIASLDFEAGASRSVRVRSTDAGLLFTEQVIAITVNDINEPPTDITLTGTTISENATVGTPIGTLGSTGDPDLPAQTFTYSLVSGAGDADNGLVQIVGDVLQVNGALSFAGNPTLEVRIQSTDSGTPPASFVKEFVITVLEAPTSVSDWMILQQD